MSIAKKKFKAEIIEIAHRWCIIRIKGETWHAIVGSFYISPSLDLNTVLDLFQPTLDDILNRYPADIVVLGGDINARTGILDDLPADIFESTFLYETRESHDKAENERGRLLLDFMTINGFVLLNGRTSSERPAHFTYSSFNGSSSIDLVWVAVAKLEYVKNLTVGNDLQGSDHFPVLLELFDDCSSSSGPGSPVNIPATNLKKLRWLQTAGEKYCRSLNISPRIFMNFETADIDVIYENLCKAITGAAGEADMYKELI